MKTIGEGFMIKKIKLFTALLLISPLANATITTDVMPYTSICQAGYPCQVGAVHNIRIVNDTPEPQTYHWFFSITADNGDAVKKGAQITLQPGQEWRQDNVKNIGYMKFGIKGRKMLHCTTQADGYEHATITKDGWADVK